MSIFSHLRRPTLSRPAVVVAKRPGDLGTDCCCVVFEVGLGEQQEFRVPTRDCARLEEGDAGTLHSRGSLFRGFDRMIDTM